MVPCRSGLAFKLCSCCRLGGNVSSSQPISGKQCMTRRCVELEKSGSFMLSDDPSRKCGISWLRCGCTSLGLLVERTRLSDWVAGFQFQGCRVGKHPCEDVCTTRKQHDQQHHKNSPTPPSHTQKQRHEAGHERTRANTGVLNSIESGRGTETLCRSGHRHLAFVASLQLGQE